MGKTLYYDSSISVNSSAFSSFAYVPGDRSAETPTELDAHHRLEGRRKTVCNRYFSLSSPKFGFRIFFVLPSHTSHYTHSGRCLVYHSNGRVGEASCF